MKKQIIGGGFLFAVFTTGCNETTVTTAPGAVDTVTVVDTVRTPPPVPGRPSTGPGSPGFVDSVQSEHKR